MQQSIERQLQHCQEMFVELEQKVSGVSALSDDDEEQRALSAKLQRLKNNLLTFQLLLQEKYAEEQVYAGKERPLKSRLTRSCSVQEILTSARGKLFRQSSLQQQRELEQGLSEQRELTKAIAARGRLHSLTADDHAGLFAPAPVVDEEQKHQQEGSVHRKWTHLQQRLTQTAEPQQDVEENSETGESAQISTPSVCVWSRDIGAMCLQELRSHITQLKQLRENSSEEPDVRAVDEGLFEVLSGLGLSLSSVSNMLLYQPRHTQTNTHDQLLQLQDLSAELSSLGSELSSQGSELVRSLGPGSAAAGAVCECVDLLQKRVCELQNMLSEKQKQLQEQLERTIHHQRKIKNMHASLLANISANSTTQGESGCDLQTQLKAVVELQQELQQKDRELEELREETESEGRSSVLTLEINTLENLLDSVWCGVREHSADVQFRLEQQQQCEWLMKSLQDLLEIAKEKLTRSANLKLDNTQQLQTHINNHSTFFLSLDARLRSLQQLSGPMQDKRPAVAELEQQVDIIQQQALDTVTALLAALKVWTQWEENQAWLEKLLQDLETQLSKIHLGEQTEEKLQECLSSYENLQAVLEKNRAQISLVLDQGTRVQKGGVAEPCVGVSSQIMHKVEVSALRLKQRLAALQSKLEHGQDSAHQMKKLWDRYHCDLASLCKWMDKAKEHLHNWTGHMTSPKTDTDKALLHYKEFIELSKELEVKSALKASVISSGTAIIQLSEREQQTHGLADDSLDTGLLNDDLQSKENGTGAINKSNTNPDVVSVMETVTENDAPTSSTTKTALSSQEMDLSPGSKDVVHDKSPIHTPAGDSISSSSVSQACRTFSHSSKGSVGGDTPVQSISSPTALSPVLLSLQGQLTQVELGWMEIYSGVPAAQQQLHQCVMDRLSPQDLLTRVSGWISAAGRRLDKAEKAARSSSTTAQLRTLLNTYKLLRREQECEQCSVDFLNHSVLKQTDPDSHRYKHTAFAEQLGELNFRWLTVQFQINIQLQQTEQKLRECADREGKLQLLQLWVKGREEWMRLARRPVSCSVAESGLKECEELEDKLKTRSAELRELRKRRLSGDEEEQRDSDFSRQIQSVDQSLAELAQQNNTLKQDLKQVCSLWSQSDSGRSLADLRTLRVSQSLEHCRVPHTSVTALEKSSDKLQTLQAEAEEIDRQWEELDHTLSSITGGIHTGTSQLLSEQQKKDKARWFEVKQNLTHTSLQSHTLLEAWRQYSALSEPCTQKLQLYREQFSSLSHTASEPESNIDTLSACVQQLHELLKKTNSLQTDLDLVHEASKDLVGQMEPGAAAFVQSECRLLTRGCLQLEEALNVKLGEIKEDLKQLQEFEQLLDSLEAQLEDWRNNQSEHADTQHTDITKSGLLELSSHSADLELLNGLSYRLTLSDTTTHRLQNLNRQWAQASAHAQEKCSELQASSLQQQDFEQRCESWMVFLQRMEDNLAVEISPTYPQLRQQLRTHQRFQAELSLGHQILHSVITEALLLLHRDEVDDRSDFLLKLAQLREHWQGAVQRAAQRRSLVEGLVQHWHLYTHTLRKLRKLLTHTHTLLPPAGPTHYNILQLRLSLQDMKRAQLLFCRSVSCYLLLLDVGRQLFSVSDEVTQVQLQTDLAALQDDWESSQCTLEKRRTLTADIIKNWESCVAGLASHAQRLEELKARLNLPIQEMEDEHQFIKEVQDSLDDWAVSLSELGTMKTDLSQYIITEDVLLLQEQVDHLHCQWEELCLKVSLRKQEIADRLNAWIIFNEKNRELCEWLTHMENKVAHSAELSIEEMVEKLKKGCMEEINLFSENKTHLKQLGEQLISASNKTKETEVNDKIKDISDRWQHLFDHIEARVRKLKETLVMVQQLDKNMSNLRTWLSRIEGELSKPVVYSICHGDEIQRKLAEQQELQRDIEQHTEGVASVLTLCDVLLHDADACGSDVENDSIQQTTRSLDRRWRNICAMSMERRMRIEETWRLWRKFLEDYSRFEVWLTTAEQTAANPASTDVLYTCAKEELKKFEAFQRQVHERLTQLELVNKQYRRLARENRTDTSNKLKTMVNEGNQRWDTLQRRVTAVLRRLKHFTSQREEFEGTREAILVWLTEMDLQLTNVEHFSESDIHDKMRQLNAFQQEITLNTNKIDALIVFGENLIQKSSPLDAVLIEDELEELHSYCQEVFGRVARFHHRLINRRPVLDDDHDFSDRDTDVEDSLELGSVWAEEEDLVDVGMSTPVEQSVHDLLPPLLEPSGRETPVSVNSIPLEWDHTVDVGGSSSPEDEDEEDVTYYSALSDVEVTESSESFIKATAQALSAASVGRSMTDPSCWHSPPPPSERKRIIHSLSSSPVHNSTSYHPQGYVKLMSECTESIDNVKRVKLILDDDELLEEQGLTMLSSVDKQTGVIERWELLQAQEAADLQQWHKLTTDLIEVTAWLDGVLPELETLRRAEASSSIRDMETSIHKLKEMQRTFNIYKSLMIGVNLSGQDIQRGDRAELQELSAGLHATNQKWTHACAVLDSWQYQLHNALLQCQEFHETLHSLLLWLARAESQRYMVNIHDLNVDTNILEEHRDALKDLQQELRGREQEVLSLQEMSAHILQLDQGEDSLEAKEKVHVISNKLRLLLRQVAQDLGLLQDRLDCEGSSVDGGEGRSTAGVSALQHKQESRTAKRGASETARPERKEASPSRPFLYRVLRAAFPLHLLFLMLLVLACLVPLSEDDYSCALSNNFARSFYPMLRYINGPPPT